MDYEQSKKDLELEMTEIVSIEDKKLQILEKLRTEENRKDELEEECRKIKATLSEEIHQSNNLQEKKGRLKVELEEEKQNQVD